MAEPREVIRKMNEKPRTVAAVWCIQASELSAYELTSYEAFRQTIHTNRDSNGK
jgi:hypothetical protein